MAISEDEKNLEGEKRRRFHFPRRRVSVVSVGAGVLAVYLAGSTIRIGENQVNGQTIIDCNKTPGQSGQTQASLIEAARLGGKKTFFGNLSGGVIVAMDNDGSMIYDSTLGNDKAKISPDRGSIIFDGVTVRQDNSLRFTDGNKRFNVRPVRDADGYFSTAEVEIFCLNKSQEPAPTPAR